MQKQVLLKKKSRSFKVEQLWKTKCRANCAKFCAKLNERGYFLRVTTSAFKVSTFRSLFSNFFSLIKFIWALFRLPQLPNLKNNAFGLDSGKRFCKWQRAARLTVFRETPKFSQQIRSFFKMNVLFELSRGYSL